MTKLISHIDSVTKIEQYRTITDELVISSSVSVDGKIAELEAIKAGHQEKVDYVQKLIDDQNVLKTKFNGIPDSVVEIVNEAIVGEVIL